MISPGLLLLLPVSGLVAQQAEFEDYCAWLGEDDIQANTWYLSATTVTT